MKAMKIAFPLLNENEMAQDFAHSQFIGIYDEKTDSSSIISLKNKAEDQSVNDFFDMIAAQGLQCVVSPFFSFMSLRVFKENNIKAYKAHGKSIDENISKFKDRILTPFSPYEALMAGGGCSSSCMECSSDMCSSH
jgi:predicted Fe-Mo cluster-binding NifX family protein